MKHSSVLPMLIFSIFGLLLLFSLSLSASANLTHAQNGYPPPVSNVILPESNPYPAPNVPASSPIEDVLTVSTSIDIIVEGLEGNDTVEIQVVPDSETTASDLQLAELTRPIVSLHNEFQRINVPAIPIGSYILTISAPASYFREPQGYLFQVQESGIVNRLGYPLYFKLIPSSAQDLPPCPGADVMETDPLLSIEPTEDMPLEEPQIICRAERIIDLSSTPKLPEQQPTETLNGILDIGYHYVGPMTYQNNNGVWGRNYVVDAGVRHSPGPEQFVAERVYANNGSNWMEAGWVELWSRDDHQYVYEYDSATHAWHYFDQFPLSIGSIVETIVYYNSSIARWWAIYNMGGGYWAVLAEESLGFSIADNAYNRGEIYTADDNHPTLPYSGFDKGYLFIDGAWRLWNSTYESVTRVDEYQPYHCDMIHEFDIFIVFSPVIFLPLIID